MALETIHLFHTVGSFLAVIAVILAMIIFKKHPDLFYSDKYLPTQRYILLAITSLHLAFIMELYLNNLFAYIILEVLASTLFIYAFLSTIYWSYYFEDH